MSRGLLRTTGGLLVATPILFTVCFTILQIRFDYPAILRAPTEVVLRAFHAGGPSLVATWYILAMTPLLFVPLALLLRRVLARPDLAYLGVATTIGVLAGLVQCLGLLRWPFLVPYLANLYVDPATNQSTREAVAVVFEAFHRYAGMAIGEQLGYLFTAVWTALVALAMRQSPLFRPWLGWVGLALAVGIAVGLLEPAGVEAAGAINAVSYLLWSAWLVVVGVFVLRARPVDRERAAGVAEPALTAS